jgi:hypothetical protein
LRSPACGQRPYGLISGRAGRGRVRPEALERRDLNDCSHTANLMPRPYDDDSPRPTVFGQRTNDVAMRGAIFDLEAGTERFA